METLSVINNGIWGWFTKEKCFVFDLQLRELTNSDDTSGISARTSLYYNSFFPSAIREWNNIPLNIRNLPTLSMFKSYLQRNKQSTPKYFYYGDRKLQILHARLRTKCSSLNYHLFLRNISHTPLCECGQMDTNFHYFLEWDWKSVV